MNNLLGIDYGTKRIGLAISSEAGGFALPLSVIENADEHKVLLKEKTIEDIVKICKDRNISKIVIGESKDFSGNDNPLMQDINSFIAVLIDRTKLPVVLHPEFLTSFQASRTINNLRGDTNMLDASAAAILLQDYIDTEKNK